MGEAAGIQQCICIIYIVASTKRRLRTGVQTERVSRAEISTYPGKVFFRFGIFSSDQKQTTQMTFSVRMLDGRTYCFSSRCAAHFDRPFFVRHSIAHRVVHPCESISYSNTVTFCREYVSFKVLPTVFTSLIHCHSIHFPKSN